MKAISNSDYKKYGCLKCGCDAVVLGSFYGRGTYPVTCRECNEEFFVLADGVNESAFSVNDKGFTKLQKHPRTGIPWHPYNVQDTRPEDGGKYWISIMFRKEND